MDAREQWIKDHVEEKDQKAVGVIDSNSIATFFTPLSDQLINEKRGTLAKVIPATACLNTSGKDERIFLSNKFQIELIVTSHDPKHMKFSGNTDITESLMICRRVRDGEGRGDTRFVSLRRNPRNSTEAIEAADAIASGKLGKWGEESIWPIHKVTKGDWSPVAFCNPELLEVFSSLNDKLESSTGQAIRELVRLGNVADVGPGGQRIRDAFDRHANDDPSAKPILWMHETGVRTTIAAEPDTIASPKHKKRDYALDILWPKAGRLLIACKINTNAIRTTSVLLDEPALGSAFVPVRPKTKDETTVHTLEKALCVWFNSTPFVICLLGARSKKLTYPHYSLDSLRSLPVPNSDDMLQLAEIYDNNKYKIIKPWPEMTSCEVRKVIDDAVAPFIGVSTATISKWREWVAEEPTVSNKMT